MPAPEILVNCRPTNGEGPAWDVDAQLLYWVDIPNATIFAYDPHSGENRSFDLSDRFGCIGTLVPRKSGGILFTPERKIASFDLRSGQVEILAEVEADLPGNRFNDGKCDPAGRFLAGTMKNKPDGTPAGALYSMDKDHSVRKLRDGLHISNGLGWSPDYRLFYLADSASRDVWMYDYDLASGDISNQRVAFRLPEGAGVADGLTTDTEGMVWLALWDGAAVTRWNPRSGELLATYPFPAKRTTCPVFGGAEMDELYVTSASIDMSAADWAAYPYNGALMRLKTSVRGMPTFAFAG